MSSKIFANGQTIRKHNHSAEMAATLTLRSFVVCTAQDVKRGRALHLVAATALSSKRFSKGTVMIVVTIAMITSIVKMRRESIPRS